MNFENTLFLAANSTRSKAYAQAIHSNGLRVRQSVIFDLPDRLNQNTGNASSQPDVTCSVDLPDLSTPLLDTCKLISDDTEVVSTGSVNDEVMLARIRQAANDGMDLVVYSGYGGELVSRDILDCGIPFLHAHSGWLPDYPGSTTIYYSLLNGDGCGVSALLLTPTIDDGPIVTRRQYPPPPAGLDIDHFYDPAIRADLMVRALSLMQQRAATSYDVSEEDKPHHLYCVIHPILKHIARRKIDSQVGHAATGNDGHI